MVETVAYAIICFVICNDCTTRDRLKKASGGTILFLALFSAYNTLQPLLPSEIDHLLHSTIWGVLFAYAVPNSTQGTDKKQEDGDENKKVDDDEQKEPNSDLN